MNTPTLYLDLVILLASVFPSGFSATVSSVFRKKREEKIDTIFLLFLVSPFFILAAVFFILKKDLFFINFPPGIFYVIAFVSIPLCFFLEYITGVIYIYFTTGKVYKGITLHSAWKSELSIPYLLLLALIAGGEEIIYRQAWFAILAGTFHLPVIVIILITSLFYGLNHFHMGINAVLAKFISGCVYGGLYVLSGYSILVPIITHVLQNLILIFLTRGKNA
jgi:membrane protease YdiL (CAAX protease family)